MSSMIINDQEGFALVRALSNHQPKEFSEAGLLSGTRSHENAPVCQAGPDTAVDRGALELRVGEYELAGQLRILPATTPASHSQVAGRFIQVQN
jgi:hypothetical protein